jgi:hypothetical protein
MNYFATHWQGIAIAYEEYNDMSLFIKKHGEPLNIEVTNDYKEGVNDMNHYKLYYTNVVFEFVRESNGFEYLENYKSTGTGKYLYDVYIGMPVEKFCYDIFGIKMAFIDKNDHIEFPIAEIIPWYSIWVSFENGKLALIQWKRGL